MRRRFGRKRSRASAPVSRGNLRALVKATLQGEAEQKQHVSLTSGQDIDWNGYIFHLSGISQGTTHFTRIGEFIQPTSLEIRGVCHGTTGANANWSVLRLMVFQWHNDIVSDAPVPQDLFDQIGGVLAPHSTLRKGPIRNAYTILKDVTYDLNYEDSTTGGDGGGGQPFARSFKFTVRPRRKVDWSTTSTISGNNHIYIAAVSNDGAIPQPNLKFVAKLMYTDV